jgi:hypothetical protein
MELVSSSGSLTLEHDPHGVGGWCQVYLVVEGARRPLGAETARTITTLITSFLTDPSSGQRWVSSLSERHTSVYGEHDGNVVLRFQDAHAKWFATLVLTPVEMSQWLVELSKHSA